MPGSYQVTKRDFSRLESLCVSCARAVPQLCPYIELEDPEVGLLAVGATAARTTVGTGYNRELLYKVTGCPRYVEGELPPIGGRNQ